MNTFTGSISTVEGIKPDSFNPYFWTKENISMLPVLDSKQLGESIISCSYRPTESDRRYFIQLRYKGTQPYNYEAEYDKEKCAEFQTAYKDEEGRSTLPGVERESMSYSFVVTWRIDNITQTSAKVHGYMKTIANMGTKNQYRFGLQRDKVTFYEREFKLDDNKHGLS